MRPRLERWSAAADRAQRRRGARRRGGARPRPGPARRADRRRSARRDRRARTRARVRRTTPSAPCDRPGVAEDVGGHHGGGEVQRRHGGERIASQDIVERPPGALPERLPVLDHHAPHRGLPRPERALLRRVPRRRGRQRPVADEPEVEDRVDLRGAARELVAPAEEQVGDRPVRARRTTASGTRRAPARRPQRLALGAREGALQAQARQLAEADDAIGDAPDSACAPARAGARGRRWASRSVAT